MSSDEDGALGESPSSDLDDDLFELLKGLDTMRDAAIHVMDSSESDDEPDSHQIAPERAVGVEHAISESVHPAAADTQHAVLAQSAVQPPPVVPQLASPVDPPSLNPQPAAVLPEDQQPSAPPRHFVEVPAVIRHSTPPLPPADDQPAAALPVVEVDIPASQVPASQGPSHRPARVPPILAARARAAAASQAAAPESTRPAWQSVTEPTLQQHASQARTALENRQQNRATVMSDRRSGAQTSRPAARVPTAGGRRPDRRLAAAAEEDGASCVQ